MTETDTTIPFLAPGCFGSALNHNGDMVCRSCPLNAECEVKAQLSMQILRDKFGITVSSRLKKAAPASPATSAPAAMVVPKKVQVLLDRLDRGGYNVIQSLKEGLNPFVGRGEMKFMNVVCALLLHPRAVVTSGLIEAGLVRKLEHSPTTAASHARMAIQMLQHIGAVEIDNGVIRIKREG